MGYGSALTTMPYAPRTTNVAPSEQLGNRTYLNRSKPARPSILLRATGS
jgi:hypothetical protein